MRKRAALARALALEAEILFLDEPTSGLDPVGARAFDRLVRVLCDSLGLTVFIVTHDLDTLLSVIDRAIVLAHGRVIADGPAAELLGGGWYFATETARVLAGAGGALLPADGARLIRQTTSIEVP
jgi:phospholipid/cholesterol/gamma-HCH transport system ATP-binding protein